MGQSPGEPSVAAIFAPAPKRRNPLTGSIPGLIGLVFLALVSVTCLVTLPYTLGRTTSASGQQSAPRYNAGETTRGRLPPAWIDFNEEQKTRVGASTDRPLLGTDVLGRSLWVRLLAGGGISLTIGLASAAISVGIGTLYGAFAGFTGGRTDAIMMRVVDVLYGLPYVLLVVLLAVASDALVTEYVTRYKERSAWMLEGAGQRLRAQGLEDSRAQRRAWLEAHQTEREALSAGAFAKLPPREISEGGRIALDLSTLLVAIGGVSWLTMARVIRGQVLSLKAQAFIEAAVALGYSRRRIFWRHLCPNLIGPILVYATLTVPQAILQESFLSFLGIGVKPPVPSWGNLAAEGLGELNQYESQWWLLLFPCLALGLTLLALNFVGEGLRVALDPKEARTR